MALVGNYPLGTVVLFRYTSPTANDRAPNVLILTPSYQNKVHGLNLRYMTPKEQQMVQWFFKSIREKMFSSDPYKQIQQEYEQQVQKHNQYLQQLAAQQNKVIVRPQSTQGTTGTFPTNNTFGATQKEISKPPVFEKFSQRHVQQNMIPPDDTMYQRIRQMFSTRMKNLVETFKNERPKDPYQFYHYNLKPLFGRDIKRFYRTYNHTYIVYPRIIKSVSLF